MPGVPGQRSGPVPKRQDQRRRQNKPAPGQEIDTAPGVTPAPDPPDERWHPIARRWYEGLEKSGQSQYYQQSDWDTAYLIAECIHRDLAPRMVTDVEGNAVLDEDGFPMTRSLPMRGASLSAYLKAMQTLLVTEGDRRRMRLELSQPETPEKSADPAVPNIADYQHRLAASG